MEVFVRDDGDAYRVFFGPDSAGYIPKEALADPTKIEYILRQVAYGYYWKVNPKTTYKYKTSGSNFKDQGIIKDIVDIFW